MEQHKFRRTRMGESALLKSRNPVGQLVRGEDEKLKRPLGRLHEETLRIASHYFSVTGEEIRGRT